MKESSTLCVVLFFFFFALRVAAAAFAALICVGLVLGCLSFHAVIRHEFIGSRRGTGTDVAFAQYDATTTTAAVEREIEKENCF